MYSTKNYSKFLQKIEDIEKSGLTITERIVKTGRFGRDVYICKWY